LQLGSENQLNGRNLFSILFCDFPLIAWSGQSHVTISLFGCAPHTKSIVGPWYWEMWELLAFEYVTLVLTKNTSFERSNQFSMC